ncbi:hypothetical protein NDU88_009638 [Pleurodeles waltl]|uniref:Uncharacterized protein n=1 Tax=Pleurodeles waltl TaxID=8319 RepID=A0AAV7RVS6_PLEWA|nr:hypothetical protein NDU88_009638 [Pleurodeles waltl]
MPCGGVTKYDPCKFTLVAWGASTNPLGCCPAPLSLASLLVGEPCSHHRGRRPAPPPHFQRTGVLHFAPCSPFPAGPGPPFGIFFRRAPEPPAGSRHQARTGSQRRPRALRDQPQRCLPSSRVGFPRGPLGLRHPRRRLSAREVPGAGLFPSINYRPLRSRVLKRAPSWLPGHAPREQAWITTSQPNRPITTGLDHPVQLWHIADIGSGTLLPTLPTKVPITATSSAHALTS